METQKQNSLKEKARVQFNQFHIGKVIHYYSSLEVGIIRIEHGALEVGDTIYFQGITTRFQQKVTSIEFEHRKVKRVGPGYDIGLRVATRVREGDDVYVLKPTV
mgnify:CR=1 FL=1